MQIVVDPIGFSCSHYFLAFMIEAISKRLEQCGHSEPPGYASFFVVVEA